MNGIDPAGGSAPSVVEVLDVVVDVLRVVVAIVEGTLVASAVVVGAEVRPVELHATSAAATTANIAASRAPPGRSRNLASVTTTRSCLCA